MKHFSTRKQLLLSVLSLLACVSMLVGSTFAWFTDSVTSAGNKIQAGTLDIDLELLKNGSWVSISEDPQPIFNYENWEPGYTEAKILKVVNNGTLALKWMAKFQAAQELSALANVIDVYVCPGAETMPADRNLTGYTKVGTLAEFVNTIETTTYGSLEAGAEAYLGIVLKMQESAGNEYQGMDLGGAFDIMIVATQYTYEEDSFDELYDEDATYGVHTAEGVLTEGASAIELELRNEAGYKVGSAVIPAAAVADAGVSIIVDDNAPYANITVAADETAKGFDVKVLGLKENNTELVKVSLRIPAGLDPDTVKLYHYDELVEDASYNPNTGYVTFESATFSPFTVVYDAESEYVAPEIPEDPETGKPSTLPTATVTEFTELDNIDWGNYGQWSPTEGLEAKLDVAYKFASPAELDEAYANWYCDYVVSLNAPLGKDEIFLGGNYGSFGWIGFHNGDVTLAAGEEIYLLESVTTNPWTYADIYNFVGEFICGVGNVGDSLEGVTFTVCLRLTNPETNEHYDVNKITYTW